MSSAAPQGFRRTVVLKSPLAERSSRDPALTNRPPNQGNSGEFERIRPPSRSYGLTGALVQRCALEGIE